MRHYSVLAQNLFTVIFKEDLHAGNTHQRSNTADNLYAISNTKRSTEAPHTFTCKSSKDEKYTVCESINPLQARSWGFGVKESDQNAELPVLRSTYDDMEKQCDDVVVRAKVEDLEELDSDPLLTMETHWEVVVNHCLNITPWKPY